MIQVINRALDMFELLASNRERALSLNEISNMLDLNPGTCANILKTLVERNYVIKEPKRKGYRLGNGLNLVLEIEGRIARLLDAGTDAMNSLFSMLSEGLILGVLEGKNRRIIHELRSPHELRVVNKIRKPVYRSSTGRMLIACMPKMELDSFIRHYGIPEEVEWPGVTDKGELMKELDKIRKKDFCIQTSVNHITGIAVPVREKEKAIASLGLYLPEVRFKGELKQKSLGYLRDTASEIEKKLSES